MNNRINQPNIYRQVDKPFFKQCNRCLSDYHTLYSDNATRYERLISRNDYQNNIVRALYRICGMEKPDVVEIGAGTGRLTSLIAPNVKSIRAFDMSTVMLDIAVDKLRQSPLHEWCIMPADHRNLPVENNSADIVIAGWTLNYLALCYPGHWKDELSQAFSEIHRVLRVHGTYIILENLGTGYILPNPSYHHRDYFEYLGKLPSVSFQWIRTDYQFNNLDDLEATTAPFFDKSLTKHLIFQKPTILPECTGIWYGRLT